MPVLSFRAKLAYFDVPKVATTGLKRLFWQIENDKLPEMALTPAINPPPLDEPEYSNTIDARTNDPRNIHHLPGFLTQSFAEAVAVPVGFETLAIVRDPILRLHSAWKEKVTETRFEARGEAQRIVTLGLPLHPSFGEFVQNFDTYRYASRPARIHTQKYAYHLGRTRQYFDHLFCIEDISDVAILLSERTEYRVKIPHCNAAFTQDRDDELTPGQRDLLIQITADDYAWLGGLYNAEDALARLNGEA